jgi:hypothetical protein
VTLEGGDAGNYVRTANFVLIPATIPLLVIVRNMRGPEPREFLMGFK